MSFQTEVLGIKFNTSSLGVTAQTVCDYDGEDFKYVVTPNVDFVVRFHKDATFREIVNAAWLTLPDGTPIIWMSRLIGEKTLKERVTGADLLPAVCDASRKNKKKLFFLGGVEGVAELAKLNFEKRFPGVDIVGTYSPPFGFEKDNYKIEEIIDIINSSEANILFVGLGSPKQEYLIDKIKDRLVCRVALCTGAAFDFAAGTKKRAPGVFRKVGLEWLWRLLLEPKRLWKRYLVTDSYILILFLKEVFRSFK